MRILNNMISKFRANRPVKYTRYINGVWSFSGKHLIECTM